MIRGNRSFQTFYSSREESNCPLITEIVRIGKKIKNNNILNDESSAIISLRYGKRVIINSDYEDIEKINRKDIIEIVDYDPVKNNILLIGPKQPKSFTPVHWMIHHARKEINVVVQLNDEKILDKINKKLPETSEDLEPGSFEMIKDVLKNLRNSKTVLIKDKGVLFVGESIKEIEEQINHIFK